MTFRRYARPIIVDLSKCTGFPGKNLVFHFPVLYFPPEMESPVFSGMREDFMAGVKMKRRWLRYVRIAGAGLVLAVSVLAFSGYSPGFARMFHGQFGPALMRCFAAFSCGALASVLGISLVTFLFGRFYCAVLCPLGILQDAAGFLSRRKGKKMVPDLMRIRYALAALTYGFLLAGWSVGFLLLDPYSNFGRMFGPFSAGALVLPMVVVILAVWKKRLFCTTFCPVGALLGLLAKKGVFRLAIREDCVKCGLCVKNCPSGCIDLVSGTLDNERCVRCMNCVSFCPRGSIGFTRTPRITSTPRVTSKAKVVVIGTSMGAAPFCRPPL